MERVLIDKEELIEYLRSELLKAEYAVTEAIKPANDREFYFLLGKRDALHGIINRIDFKF